MVRIVFDVQRLMVGATAEVLLILDVLCCECAVRWLWLVLVLCNDITSDNER